MKKRAKKMNQKQMAKKIKLAILSCLIIFSFITEKVNLVYADTTTSIDVIFDQKFVDKYGNTDTTVKQEFIYELVANISGNPMPAGSVGDVYETTLKGNVGGSTTIVFDKTGVFEYTLKASSKNDLQGFTPASEMSYRIEITILKKFVGDLEPFVLAFNSDGEKVVDPPFIYTVKGEQTAIITPEVTITTPPEVTKQPQQTITTRPTRKPVNTPNQSGTTGKGGGSKTGDTTKIYTLVALAVASTGVIILAIAKRRKRDDEI